jgi:mono/diheme cytochrome c family protein
MTQKKDAFYRLAGLRPGRRNAAALLLLLLTAMLIHAATPAVVAPASVSRPGLVWEPASQYYTVKQGEVAARFTFKVKNVSGSEYVIDDIKTSCDCTTAGIPSKPWHLAPGETNKLEAVVDLRDHMKGVTASDIILKEIFVYSTNATNILSMTITIPPGMTNTLSKPEADRIWGQQLAAVDHQAVFKTTCVNCHLVPAFGKYGESLYHTACGICHDDAHRAPMVPDLRALKTEIDTNYWHTWIVYGKVNTLMPGFANTEGGPLEAAQIDSLVNYMTNAFPRPMKGATNLPAMKPAKKGNP